MDKKPRDRRVVAPFVDYLRRKHKPFAKLEQGDQLELAHIIWNDGMKSREHQAEAGATSYGYKELESRFGRSRFIAVNDTAKAFQLGGYKWHSDGSKGHTRVFRLSKLYAHHRREYLNHAVKKMTEPSEMLYMTGETVRTTGRAISGVAKLWGGVEMVEIVRVRRDRLQALFDQTWREIGLLKDGRLQGNLWTPAEQLDVAKLERRADAAAAILVLANTRIGGQDWIPIRYREAESGRLYALDTNLQNCPSEVRREALSGSFDYDISNCHYTLLDQMARREGISSPHIRHYLDYKDLVRNELSADVGADKNSIKICLVALIYGAPKSSSKFTAIGDELGKERAKRLIEHPRFKDLAQDVTRAIKAVLAAAPVRSGSLMNAAGCGIKLSIGTKTKKPEIKDGKPPTRPKKVTNSEKLSHLLQGAEALILKNAVEYAESQRAGNVMLLQHDGFTAQERVDCSALARHILRTTGFMVEFEEKQLQPTEDRDFSKLIMREKEA